jgi:hypothetical protein
VRRRVWVEEICYSRNVWSDTFQQFKPLVSRRGIGIRETGKTAAWPRQALHHTGGDRVAYLYKDRGRPAHGILDRRSDRRRIDQDYVRPQVEQLFGETASLHRVARAPAIDELDIAALCPTQGL